MTPTDLDLFGTLVETFRSVSGLRTVRLARPGETVEVPLSRLPAAILEPTGVERLTWPEVPVGRYRLLHWRVSVLDRAVPHTRAFEALVALADACRDALAADLLLGDKAEDGPPSGRDPSLEPAVGATRTGPSVVGETTPGRPTAVRFGGACGYWSEAMAGQATLDDEPLFGSGPHLVEVASPVRRVADVTFNGLAAGLTLDLGEGPRAIRQRGVLSADTDAGLALLVAACEAFIDGRTYILTAPDGTDYAHCRTTAFERIGPPRVGARWHLPYAITYEQLAR
ncbi:MAG: hypothetical protein U9R68_10245 [Planctomycetota bacterium]|nr:hypothetical protein [Planctomycetota bacterium]